MANQIYDIPKSITIIYRFKQNPDEKSKNEKETLNSQQSKLKEAIIHLQSIPN